MDFTLLASPLLWRALIEGLLVTLQLVGWSLLAGAALGLPLALARTGRRPALRRAATAYSFLFRGTPLLVQLYVVYYGLAQFDVIRDSLLWRPVLRHPYWCAVITLSLHSAAYGAEIIRGAILAIPPGVMEAAKALGMKAWQRALLVGLPIGVRAALGPLGNEIVLTIKATATVSLVGVFDILGEATIIRRDLLDPVTPLVAAGAIYLGLVLVVRSVMSVVERRMNRHRAPASGRRSTRANPVAREA